jgi:hypothetical protein
VSSQIGSWSSDGFLNFQRTIKKVKIHWIEELFIPLESSWNVDVEMGLNDPFGYSKHKLWSKKGPGVKLTI